MMKNTGSGVLRDLLSSVAPQWAESHFHPRDYSESSSTSTSAGRRGRGSRRIRSWIVHDKDRDEDDGGDNSLHFTDVEASSDDFAHGTIHNHDHVTQNRNQATDATMHTLPTGNASERVRQEEEETAVDLLTALMGDGFDREVVRRILRKYDGNVDKAAGALVEGERGEEMMMGPGALIGPLLPQQQQQAPVGHQIQSQGWPAVVGPSTPSPSWSLGTPGSGSMQTHTGGPSSSQTGPHTSAMGGRPNTPVIDLTLDDASDPDLQRAMQESMNTLHASSSNGNYAPSYTSRTGFQTLSQAYAPPQREGQMTQSQQQQQQPEGPVFGPSERPPDPNWAIVPSHVRVSTHIFLYRRR